MNEQIWRLVVLNSLKKLETENQALRKVVQELENIIIRAQVTSDINLTLERRIENAFKAVDDLRIKH